MKRSTILLQGFIGGLVGYALVATSFALMNLLQGRSPVFTAALLGQAFFGRLTDPTSPALDPGPIIAYNGLHLALFLVIGVAAAWALAEAELHPRLWYLIFFAFLAGFIYAYFGVLVVTQTVAAPLSAGAVAVANVVAVAGMGVYLAWAHPRLREAIEMGGDPDRSAPVRLVG